MYQRRAADVGHDVTYAGRTRYHAPTEVAMNLSWLGAFHPQIVHTPIVLLISSAFFALLGRLTDRDWVKKMSVVMLVFGFLGAFLAVQSGKPAHRVPEHQQGVPEQAIDTHEMLGERTMYLSGLALLALFVASRLKGGIASVVSGLGLILQLLAAGAVGYTAHLGGKLVYEHGANVKVDGNLVKSIHAGEHAEKPGEADEDEKK
jgi:uncharacterized membrane protein